MAYFKTFLLCFVHITLVQSWASSASNSICSTWHGLVPHPNNCQLFYLCAHGNGCIMECSKGTFFHPTLKVCVWPGVADCSHSKGSSMTQLPARRCSSGSVESMTSNEVVPHPRPPMPSPTTVGYLPHPTPPSVPTTPHGPSIHTPISPAHGRPPVFPPASSTAPPYERPPIHPTVLPPARPTPPPHERPPIHPPVLPPSPSPGQQIVFPTHKPSISPYPNPSASERPPIHPPILPPSHSTPSPHERPPIHPPILPPSPSTPSPHERPPIHPPILPPSPSTQSPHVRPPIHPPILPPSPSTRPPHERPPIHPPILPPSPSSPAPHERPPIHPPVLPPSGGGSSCCCNDCCKKCQDPDYKPRPDGNHHSASNETHSDMSSGYPIPSDLANAIIAISNDLISSKDKVNIHKLNGTMEKIISKYPSGQTPLLLIYRNPQDGHLELLADIINNIT